MKGSLLNKLPGSTEQKFAQLRALYAYMWAHPGKKLLFMGGEFGQWREWTETESLDWHLIEDPLHSGVQRLVRDLNDVYGANNALWEGDSQPEGFEWLDVDNALENVVAFMRKSPEAGKQLICIGNFSAVRRRNYRLSLPMAGEYKLLINTDANVYSSAADVDVRSIAAEEVPHHGRQYSATFDLPPLSTLWFEAPK
jgi:1,4-alpha-glucan branching enzyme